MSKCSFFRFSISPHGLYTVGGTVCAIATILGFLGKFSWALDLLSHFRVQYFLVLLLIMILMGVSRRWKQAMVFGFFAAVNLALILPLYFGSSQTMARSAPMRVILMNVNTRQGNPEKVLATTEDLEPDLLLLEEVDKGWIENLAKLTNTFPYSLSVPRSDNFGMAFFSKFPIESSRTIYPGGAGVPSILADVATPAGKVTILGTHPLPPANPEYSRLRNEQLAALVEQVNDLLPPLLMLGDLNVTPFNRHFRNLLESTALEDSAKGFGVQPTWPGYNLLLRIPLDHCLHSPDIIIINREVGPEIGSDHFPLIVDFALPRLDQE